jgi:hypothetical protein
MRSGCATFLATCCSRRLRPSLVKTTKDSRNYAEALPGSARCSGTEANNYGQCAIDFPKLAKREKTMRFA